MRTCDPRMLACTMTGGLLGGVGLGALGYALGSLVAAFASLPWALLAAGVLGGTGALLGGVLGGQAGVLAWVWLLPRRSAY